MNANSESMAATPPHDKLLQVQVRYVAKAKPFEDKEAPDTTLSTLKPAVLEFFGLKEGDVGGGTKTYNFVHGETKLTDLSTTLGSLAGDAHELKLKLVEQLTQG